MEPTAENLPARAPAPRGVREDEALFDGLPEEALRVCAEILCGAEEERDRALGARLAERAGFVLSAAPEGGPGSLFASIPPFPRETRRREPPNPAAYAQLDPATVRRWFEAGGLFERAMPGYESRPEQVRMAGEVAAAFSAARHLVVEAGTGVGKTMAYLVPAALWSLANDLPVVVSTNTKNLQDQIFRKDLPLVAKLLRSPVRFALVKGRGNYLCLSRLERLVGRRESELSPAAMPALARAVAWALRTLSGDLSEFDPGPAPAAAEPGEAPVAARIASDADDCRGRKCPHYGRCFLQRARAASLAADIVVTNHAVFFSEPESAPLALPKAAQVVFDEAHNLEAAATDHFAREVTPRSLRQALRRIHDARRPASARRRRAPAAGSGLFADLERMLAEGDAGPMASAEARDAMQRLVAEARTLAEAAARSGQAWFRALGALPPRGESQLRLRPATLEGGAWAGTIPALQRFQDDLYALSRALSLLSKVFHPEPGKDPPALPEDRAGALALAQGTAAGGAGGSPAGAGVVLALAPGTVAGADDPLAEMRVAAQAAEAARKLEAAESAVQGLLDTVDFLSRADDPDWAYWIEMAPGRGGRPAAEAGLRAAPVEVAKWLAEGLFAKLDTVVLCSATMSVSGSSAFLAHRLGLDLVDPDRVAECRLGSPFDYARQCLAAVPAFLPPQAAGPGGGAADEAFADAFGGLLARLAAIARGRTLALFTSYATMLAAARRAAPDLERAGIRLLVQGGGPSREALTASFRDEEAGPAVLFGTNSFWEGVDLIGDALRCLVIAKLPFDPPGEPLVDARSERVEQTGGSAFRDYAVPNAVIRLRQGFGRLIRHRSDRGVAILADPRLYTKGYGAIFRRNLPAELARYEDEASLLADVAAFLR